MRERKIRVWDRLKKKMIYPHEQLKTWKGDCDPENDWDFHTERVLMGLDGRIIIWNDEHDFCEHIMPDGMRFIPMDFVGLKDKNGKEIYEGDIVKYSYYVDYGQSGELKSSGKPEIIKWDIYRCGFNPLMGWTEYHEQLRTCEVIGNRLENPELLKEK